MYNAADAERLANMAPRTPGWPPWPQTPEPKKPSSGESAEEVAARDPIYAEYRHRTADIEPQDGSGNRWVDDDKLGNLVVGVFETAADAHGLPGLQRPLTRIRREVRIRGEGRECRRARRRGMASLGAWARQGGDVPLATRQPRDRGACPLLRRLPRRMRTWMPRLTPGQTRSTKKLAQAGSVHSPLGMRHAWSASAHQREPGTVEDEDCYSAFPYSCSDGYEGGVIDSADGVIGRAEWTFYLAGWQASSTTWAKA